MRFLQQESAISLVCEEADRFEFSRRPVSIHDPLATAAKTMAGIYLNPGSAWYETFTEMHGNDVGRERRMRPRVLCGLGNRRG